MEFSLAFWLGFLVFVLVALAIDMGVLHRRPRALSFKEASNLTAIWVLLASIFCTFIYFVSNEQKALEFFRLNFSFIAALGISIAFIGIIGSFCLSIIIIYLFIVAASSFSFC